MRAVGHRERRIGRSIAGCRSTERAGVFQPSETEEGGFTGTACPIIGQQRDRASEGGSSLDADVPEDKLFRHGHRELAAFEAQDRVVGQETVNGRDHRIHIAARVATQVDDDAFQTFSLRRAGLRQGVEYRVGVAQVLVFCLPAESRQRDQQDAVSTRLYGRLCHLILGRTLFLPFYRKDEGVLSAGYFQSLSGDLIGLLLCGRPGRQRLGLRLFPGRPFSEQAFAIHQFDGFFYILLLRRSATGNHQRCHNED